MQADTPECKYKLAQIALKLNDHSMAERMLLNGKWGERNTVRISEIDAPKGASGFYLLGTVYERKGQYQKAEECFIEALRKDPTLWVAFERLQKYSVNDAFPLAIIERERSI